MNFLTQMTIRIRLLLAFACLTLITAGVGWLGMYGTATAVNTTDDMYRNQLVPIKYLANANMEAIYMNRALFDYVIEPEKTGMDRIKTVIEEHHKHYAKHMADYTATDTTPPEKTLIAKLEAAWPAYLASADKVMKFSYADQNKEAVETMNGEATKTFQVLDDALTALVEINIGLAKDANVNNQRLASKERIFSLVAIGLAIAASIVLAMLITSSITKPLSTGVSVAKAVAAGDLTVQINPRGRDEVTELLIAMASMKDGLAHVVTQVRSGSESVATASTQIAQGTADLSARVEEEASSLQQISAAMEELGANFKQNMDGAQQANQLAGDASTVAVQGGQVVGEVVDTMRGINEASHKISEIISVIDGIAFQTNILALNAAVEAARAGEQGRGFAVVASEVRSLAGRSADAAKEIKTLISTSVERVERGTALVDKAGTTMNDVVTAIKRVTDLMGDINASSQEQVTGVTHVGEGVSHIDQATQQNASLVEEMAAASASLKDQAQDLVQLVSTFKLGSEANLAPKNVRAGTVPFRGSERGTVAAPVAKSAKPSALARPAAPASQLATAAPGSRAGDDEWDSF